MKWFQGRRRSAAAGRYVEGERQARRVDREAALDVRLAERADRERAIRARDQSGESSELRNDGRRLARILDAEHERRLQRAEVRALRKEAGGGDRAQVAPDVDAGDPLDLPQ